MALPKITTVLFDLDGTLVDSRADLAAAVNHALHATGLPPQAEEEIVPHVGNGMRVLLSEVMGPVPDETLEQGIAAFAEFYDAHCVDGTVLYDGVREGIEALSPAIRLGIVTNKPERFAAKILSVLGVKGRISTIVGGDSLPERKPHPAPMLKAARDLGGAADACLVVGDGTQDIQAGQAAGMKTCAARYGYGFRPAVLDLRPDFSVDSFNEIKELVL